MADMTGNPSNAAPRPANYMRAWRQLAGLSLKEMSRRLKDLKEDFKKAGVNIARYSSPARLERMERGEEPCCGPDARTFHIAIVDGYAMVLDCADFEILELPPCTGSIHAWLTALTSEQRRTVGMMLQDIENAHQAAKRASDLELMTDSELRTLVTQLHAVVLSRLARLWGQRNISRNHFKI